MAAQGRGLFRGGAPRAGADLWWRVAKAALRPRLAGGTRRNGSRHHASGSAGQSQHDHPQSRLHPHRSRSGRFRPFRGLVPLAGEGWPRARCHAAQGDPRHPEHPVLSLQLSRPRAHDGVRGPRVRQVRCQVRAAVHRRRQVHALRREPVQRRDPQHAARYQDAGLDRAAAAGADHREAPGRRQLAAHGAADARTASGLHRAATADQVLLLGVLVA